MTTSLSSKNIIYSFNVAPIEDEDEEEFHIDSNELIEERMKEVEEEYERIRLEEERRMHVRYEMQPVYDEEGNEVLDDDGNPLMQEVEVYDEPGEEELTEGLEDYAKDSESQAMLPEEVQEEAEAIIADAQSTAETIINDANAQADGIREQAMEAGRQEGFEEGIRQANDELAQQRENLSEMERTLVAEFEEKQSNMEKELVDIIAQLYEKVFSVNFSDDKNIVLHLVENAVSHAEGSKQLLIRANEDAIEVIKEKKEELQSRVGSDVTLDLIPDALLKEGECLIETDGGIFDCSIDTELKNLTKKIRSLTM